ncbi:hypothetical protein LCL89_06965 [Halobacillus yeomjeoni]|uniref:hypothetical protein n=1 Tax=Halobacillus yeomjeoni TaxID=311194 RepID=UPI001CD7F91C|nr:hypothetical protein [Halobacillus yeomjeoni]MCA0983797.1 hypothetical protein [Halobacillus yeomjeoni]
MKRLMLLVCALLILIIGLFHLFALMRLYPLYITSPLLFAVIYMTIAIFSHRKTFRGF